jgi:hypothetical protein
VIVLGQRTPTAYWDSLTREIGGSYVWWGFAFRWVFIGIMWRERRRTAA